MADRIQTGVIEAARVARETPPQAALNGLRYAVFGDTGLDSADVQHIVQAVPGSIAAALTRKVYYFVPLALAEPAPGEPHGHRRGPDETLIALAQTPELAELAICHRALQLPRAPGDSASAESGREAIFISTGLFSDRFSLAFELFINVGHAFVDAVGVPAGFSELAWNQATADVRGETSQDAWEGRSQALNAKPANQLTLPAGKPRIDEKAKSSFLQAAFADAMAIYLLSLAVDFDYSELREREYPLLAPQALAERLRLMARLFPPNSGYEFAVRYRRRA